MGKRKRTDSARPVRVPRSRVRDARHLRSRPVQIWPRRRRCGSIGAIEPSRSARGRRGLPTGIRICRAATPPRRRRDGLGIPSRVGIPTPSPRRRRAPAPEALPRPAVALDVRSRFGQEASLELLGATRHVFATTRGGLCARVAFERTKGSSRSSRGIPSPGAERAPRARRWPRPKGRLRARPPGRRGSGMRLSAFDRGSGALQLCLAARGVPFALRRFRTISSLRAVCCLGCCGVRTGRFCKKLSKAAGCAAASPKRSHWAPEAISLGTSVARTRPRATRRRENFDRSSSRRRARRRTSEQQHDVRARCGAR